MTEVAEQPRRDGVSRPIPMGLVAAAGKPPEEISVGGVRFGELHRGGWDPDARLADQDRDGVAAEIIYPTVADHMNRRRLMWANDFPHSDSTWPWSQEMLAEHTTSLSPEQQQAINSGNVADLYGIDLSALV